MKKVLRHFVFDTYSLWVASKLASGMEFEKGFITLLMAGVGLTIASLIAKPVINLLLLPLNLITYGLFRWVSSAVVLFLVTLVVKDFRVLYFSYPGLMNKWLEIPPINVNGYLAYIGFAFILSIFSSFIYWLIK